MFLNTIRKLILKSQAMKYWLVLQGSTPPLFDVSLTDGFILLLCHQGVNGWSPCNPPLCLDLRNRTWSLLATILLLGLKATMEVWPALLLCLQKWSSHKPEAQMGGQSWSACLPTPWLVSTCNFQRLPLTRFDLEFMHMESTGPG